MLTIVVGLPGSGKTHLAVIEFLKDRHLSIYEDFLGGGLPWARSLLDGLVNAIRLHRPVMANDALLCLGPRRAEFQLAIAPHLTPEYPARWVYFANSPETCRRNVERRFRAEGARSPGDAAARRWSDLTLIDALAPSYCIPDGFEALPVVDYLA